MKIQRRSMEPEADTYEIIKRAMDEIVTAKLSRCKNGCLVSVRRLSSLIARNTGLSLNNSLTDVVDSLLREDKRAQYWGYGGQRTSRSRNGKKYVCSSARIFQLRSE